MKSLTTRKPWERVLVAPADGEKPEVWVGAEPITVSDAHATTYAKAAEALDVEIVVADAGDDEPAAPAVVEQPSGPAKPAGTTGTTTTAGAAGKNGS